jgi:allophanate hydrolase
MKEVPGESGAHATADVLGDLSLDIGSLAAAYRAGATTPTAVVEALCARADRAPSEIWIHRVPRAVLLAAARALEQRASDAGGRALPLFGIPVAVKDNIDVAGLPTTAACPAFEYMPRESAPVVRRLIDAGALVVGKTNMDQLATGLVGVRSPYGVPRNPFDARYISGGSSSGSAVAVASGLASFALGTDTAGSGRVPAAFNNLVGLKPTGGLFSTSGVVPACRSLDCVSIFALTVEDACRVAGLISGGAAGDPTDTLLRANAGRFDWSLSAAPRAFRFAVPGERDREFFGDAEAQRLYVAAIERWRGLGGTPVAIDLEPFVRTARLLYDGPWIAERLAPFRDLVGKPEALLPVVREILAEGTRFSAVDLFEAQAELDRLRAHARKTLADVDFLLVPSTPTIYTVEEIVARPRDLNARLGLYTNFVNLLQLCALAVPNGFRADGLPSGVTLIGLPEQDHRLAAFGAAYQRELAGPLGATGRRAPATEAATPPAVAASAASASELQVAVVGAHLSGQPLNHQLTDLGARLVRTCRTSAYYRLYALPGTVPPKPGLVRVGGDGGDPGTPIEVEVWRIDRARFGDFFARVPAPLCLGTVELEDGARVSGFLCETYAVAGARDISTLGGWRAFLAAGAAAAAGGGAPR